jgi:hypothetical protein
MARSTRDRELADRSEAFLGLDTNLFWFMGRLVEKGTQQTGMPVWSDAGATPRSGKVPPRGGEGKAGKVKAATSDEPGAKLKAALARVDRDVPHVVLMKVDGRPEDSREFLAWLKEEQARDAGLVLVTARDLRGLVEEPDGEIAVASLVAAFRAGWSGGPPDSLVVDGRPVSLADAYEVMARHLAGQGDTIRTTGVVGPTGRPEELVQATGKVDAKDVVAAAAGALRAIEASPWRAIPTVTRVGKADVGFHQFAWLMSEAISGGGKGRIEVPAATHAPPYMGWLSARLVTEPANQRFWMEAQAWTIEPAVWKGR